MNTLPNRSIPNGASIVGYSAEIASDEIALTALDLSTNDNRWAVHVSAADGLSPRCNPELSRTTGWVTFRGLPIIVGCTNCRRWYLHLEAIKLWDWAIGQPYVLTKIAQARVLVAAQAVAAGAVGSY